MYRIPESIRSTHSQDGAVVLDIRHGQMFNLNFVGSRILKLVESGSAQPEIVDEIVREFAVSQELAQRDVQTFLKSLSEYHLIELAPKWPPKLRPPWTR